MEKNKDTRKSKLCFDMRVCRRLIHMGCNVIDIKPLRGDEDKTVLVFEDTPEFQKALEIVAAEFKAKDEARLKEALERPEAAD